MYTYVKRNQFDFQRLNEELILVTFFPVTSKFSKDQRFVLLKKGAEYYELALKVHSNYCNDFEMRHLADFVDTYNGVIV